MIRVLIADDHEVVRQGIRTALAEAPDIEVVAEAGDGRRALDLVAAGGIDVLVLDLSLPRVSGLEVVRRVHETTPQLPVLILSMYPEEQFASRLLSEGAAGYVSKERPLSELEQAIRAVHGGGRWTTQKVPTSTEEGGKLPHQQLSAREHQVFMLLLQGRGNADIAAELDLVPSTVSNHLARIKVKLGARTLADIVSYAHRVGLVS